MHKLMAFTMAAVLTLPLFAFQPAAGNKDFKKQIDELMAMPSKERLVTLKKMDPIERRGLWFQLKKEENARKGVRAKSGAYQNANAIAIDVQAPGFQNPQEVIGTIRYDDGFATIGFGGGAIVGNRFNSHTGLPMLTSGTVSTIRAVVVPGPANTTSSAGFVLLGPQTGGGGAMAIFSTFGVATGVIDTVSFSGIGASYTGTEFFVLFGDFASSYIPVFGTGTTLAQGHHGVVGYTGGMGPNITGTFNFGGTLNSLIRASGNIVPVELMSFEIE